MTARLALPLAALFALSACGEDGLVDELARDQARSAVNPVLAERFPGLPLEPATNCVINNASSSEIFQLASAGVTGVDGDDTQLIFEIATRPDTVDCLLKSGLTALL